MPAPEAPKPAVAPEVAAQIPTPTPVVTPEVAAQIPTPTPVEAPEVAAQIPAPTPPPPAKAGAEPPGAASPAATRPAPASVYTYDWLMQQPRSSWVVQLVASTDRRDVEAFLTRHGLKDGSAVFAVKRDGRTWYHAVNGLYPSMRSAQAAVEALPPALRAVTQPWPRSLRTLASLQ